MPSGCASMLLLGEGSEATEPYNKCANFFNKYAILPNTANSFILPFGSIIEWLKSQLPTMSVVLNRSSMASNCATILKSLIRILWLLFLSFDSMCPVATAAVFFYPNFDVGKNVFFSSFPKFRHVSVVYLEDRIVSTNINYIYTTVYRIRFEVEYTEICICRDI